MDDSTIKPITNQGFFTYVFKLSKFKQEDLMNIVQYTLLSISPVILFVYFSKKYFPTVHENDSSLYIFIITVIQLLFMIIGIFFIDRIINYIPTLSGKYYETINLTTIVIIFVLFMLLINGGFRERTKILLHRFDTWFSIDDTIVKKLGGNPKKFEILTDDIIRGNRTDKNNKSKNSNVNATNSGIMTQQSSVTAPLPTQGPSMVVGEERTADTPAYVSSRMPGISKHSDASMQNYHSNGYQQPTDNQVIEPMAANDALGGGCSWSKW